MRRRRRRWRTGEGSGEAPEMAIQNLIGRGRFRKSAQNWKKKKRRKKKKKKVISWFKLE
jgi:hypothetical protein